MSGNRIEEIRKDRGLTQDQLAERLNTDKGTVSRLENGRRRLTQDWMDRIARVLECAPWELLPLPDVPAQLTPEERDLLETFRGLSEPDRARFTAVAEALLRAQKKEGG